MTRAPLVFVALVACGPGTPIDAGVVDGGRTCSPNVPPPSAPCIPQCGNELGVGQPCTKGGNECSDFDLFAGQAGFCTIDAYETDLAFCTRPCTDDDSVCGADAYCDHDPNDPTSGSGCVPLACKDWDAGG